MKKNRSAEISSPKKPGKNKSKKNATNPGLPNNDPDQTPDREVWGVPLASKNKKTKNTDYATNPKLPGNDPDQTPEREIFNEPIAKKRTNKRSTASSRIGFKTPSTLKKSRKSAKKTKKRRAKSL